jgi:hypothetical protein
VLNRSELLNGQTDVEYFHPVKFRLEPDLLVAVLGGLVYSGDIVLAITGDKIDSGKITLLAERGLEELKQFKHVEAPKEINVAVLRSLVRTAGLSPGWRNWPRKGEEPVKQLLEAVSKLVGRVLTAGTDLQGKLTFWGKPCSRTTKARLAHPAGSAQDLHRGADAVQHGRQAEEPAHRFRRHRCQKKNLEVLAAVESCWNW